VLHACSTFSEIGFADSEGLPRRQLLHSNVAIVACFSKPDEYQSRITVYVLHHAYLMVSIVDGLLGLVDTYSVDPIRPILVLNSLLMQERPEVLAD
jgi:hypothetical protein